MYPDQRREALLRILAEQGFVSFRELAVKLGVSEITIRRDMKALEDEGWVKLAVGGAKYAHTAEEPPFLAKRVLQSREKERIADAALGMMESGMTVGFSSGTTTWTLARKVRGLTDMTFVTNSTNIAIELKSNGWQDIHLTGGQFRTPSDALVGPLAEACARQLHTDILFIGVHGMDVMYGLSTPNLLEASVNRVLMEHTNQVVLLADQTKWGIRALAHMAEWRNVHVLVTDSDDRPEIHSILEYGVEVRVADPDARE